jgi:hypothetical protein
MHMRFIVNTLIASACLLLSPFVSLAQELEARCGIVDSIGMPLETGIVEGYDDFARYRARFGGNHTGLDIGFDHWGDPVFAAARGRVTYADPEGWDTEKGVVIIEHTFPDGSIAYTLYGHMEQSDTLIFPLVGQCIERGDIVGAIGWPSRGRPHLHYEIRNFLPNDGGPGYVVDNPLSHGWYHPLDFTQLWQMRLSPAFIDYATFDIVPTVPPLTLESGVKVIANGDTIEGIRPPAEILWRVQADGVITGLAALSGDRVIAHTRNGQVVALQNGRYAALWDVPGPDEPFAVLGETLVFVTDEGGLAAFDAAGYALWTVPPTPGALVVDFRGNGTEVALSLRTPEGVSLRIVDGLGDVTYDEHLLRTPVIGSTSNGSWLILEGTQLARIEHNSRQALGVVSPPPGRTANLTADMLGNSYIYLGDNDDTLLALGPNGEMRWRVDYPPTDNILPPLLRTGNGCLLYALDADGKFNVFNTANGELLTQMQLYAGGNESSRPRARVLNIDAAEHINIASGFLTMVTMDGWLLGGEVMQNCRMG